MGVYYTWVNATKMEHMGNEPFACSDGIMENCRYPNDRTDVVLTLLAGRWHGDLVAYVNESTDLKHREGKGFRHMAELVPEFPCDYIEAEGYDVGSLFSCFKGVEDYFPTEDDPYGESMHPYEGPLDQEAVFYRYVVNETRKEYLDRLAGRHLTTVDGVDILEDVTPAILGDTFRLDWRGERMDEGPWVGDIITPTNERPGPDFTDVTPDYSIW